MRTEKSSGKHIIQSIAALPDGKDVSGLRKLFLEELREIYWAEKELIAMLPKIADSVSSEELADAILDNLAMSFTHVNRIEDSFVSLHEEASETRCETMEGLIGDAARLVSTGETGLFRDAAVLSVMKRIRYYEIASYGILCSFAKTLGEIEVLTMMEDSLDEERESYRTLIHSSRFILNT
jgi:ferritin-like metal-binding protein YciE